MFSNQKTAGALYNIKLIIRRFIVLIMWIQNCIKNALLFILALNKHNN